MKIINKFKHNIQGSEMRQLMATVAYHCDTFMKKISGSVDHSYVRAAANYLVYEAYPEVNSEFKRISGYKSGNNIHNLWKKSYKKTTILDILTRNPFDNRRIYSQKTSRNNFSYVKFEFTENSLHSLLNAVLAVLFVHHNDELFEKQAFMSYLLSVVEFYRLYDVDWNLVRKVWCDDILHRDFCELNRTIDSLKENDLIPTQKKRRPEGMKYKKHKEKFNIQKEEIEELLKDNNKTKTQMILSKKYNVSVATIRNIMSAYELTDQKHTNKRYK